MAILKDIKIKQPLDREWLKLILEAKSMGLTVEDIRNFLMEAKRSEKA